MDLNRSSNRTEDLDAELIGLITAARRLAYTRFSPGFDKWAPTRAAVVCEECGRLQLPEDLGRHYDGCKVGAVLARLNTIEKFAASADEPVRVETLGQLGEAIADAGAYGEPWQTGLDLGVRDRLARVVADLVGSDLAEGEDPEYARRISAAVNFCAGVPTEHLEGCRLIYYRPDTFRASLPAPRPRRVPTLVDEVIARVDAQMCEPGGGAA